MLKLLLTQENLDRNNLKEAQRNGIERAKEAGKYKGRKKIPIDANLLAQVAAQFRTHQITEGEAMMRLGIRSRSTFYRRLREVEGTPLTLEKGQST
jgi:DNA invertase Pin-like site-specific DNA recombinase